MHFINRYRVGLLLGLIKFILPFLLQNPLYELHRDEMLYIEQGNHLAWGFMEVPPLLSVFSKLALLAGGSFFWVKFWPALFGGLTVFVTCSLCRQMGGKTFAQFVAGLCLIVGVYLRVHFLFQPGFLEIFFWTLSAYYLVRYLNTSANKYLYLLAIALGLGWLSKYSVSFFIAGILVGLVLTTSRKVFSNKHFYYAGALALLIIFPNLIWQYQHKWPVIHHMKELRETQLQFIAPTQFLLNQVLMHISYCFIWVGGLIWLLFFRTAKLYRPIAWLYITVIVLLMVGNGKDYYSLGAYPLLFAAGGVWVEAVSARRIWIRYATTSLTFLLCLPLVPLMLPVWKPATLAAYYKQFGIDKTGALKWEDLKEHELPQDFADMISWNELGDKVSEAYNGLPDSLKPNTLIYCRNYALAGAVTYYGKNIPKPVSDNASFLIWMPDEPHVRNLLFVGKRIPAKDDMVFQQFEKYTVLDSTTTPMAREKGVKIILYQNANNKTDAMIKADIKEMKAEFGL